MILELLQKRFSCRKFQGKQIPDAVIEEMLEAARLSPSGGNEQPWRFGIITDPALIAQIAEVSHKQTWIADAPLLIVLCICFVSDKRGGRDIQKQRFPEYAERFEAMEQRLYRALNQEEHQTKIAGTHMAIAALEHGIHSCWISRFEVMEVAKLLRLPDDCLPSEILVCGYPEKPHNMAQKKHKEKIVFYNAFTNYHA
jgi:nitroreductase